MHLDVIWLALWLDLSLSQPSVNPDLIFLLTLFYEDILDGAPVTARTKVLLDISKHPLTWRRAGSFQSKPDFNPNQFLLDWPKPYLEQQASQAEKNLTFLQQRLFHHSNINIIIFALKGEKKTLIKCQKLVNCH